MFVGTIVGDNGIAVSYGTTRAVRQWYMTSAAGAGRFCHGGGGVDRRASAVVIMFAASH